MRLMKTRNPVIVKIGFDPSPPPGRDLVTGACYVEPAGVFHYYANGNKIARWNYK